MGNIIKTLIPHITEDSELKDEQVGDVGGGDGVGHVGCWIAALRSQ